MNLTSHFAGSLLLLWTLFPSSALAAKASQTVAFDTRSVATTIWYPDNLDVIRGVLVFTGPQGTGESQDTRDLVDDAFWQRFAESTGFALLGDQFSGVYTDAATGPGQALIDALTGLASATRHPELARAPLLLKGFSNGGYFSFTFAQFAPSRVIAFCLNKSGYATAPLSPALLAIPGLFVWGSDEPATNTPTVIHSLVQAGRLQHALWAELKEWDVAHAEGAPERVYAPFFAEMIAARYPAHATPRDRDVALIALSETAGWLGDHSDDSLNTKLPTIAPFYAYTGDRSTASWLPSHSIANLWRGFVTKSPITLSSPAPSAVLDANQPVQLTAADLGDAERADFRDGDRQLSAAVLADAGGASLVWDPDANSISGFLALGMDANGAVISTSRPTQVVLFGKTARMVQALDDAGTLADAATDASATVDSGSATDAGDAATAADGGRGVEHGAGIHRGDMLSGGGGCSVRSAMNGSSRTASGLWVCSLLAACVLRRRRNTCR